MKILKDKTAIITGATRGIGRGLAEIFAKQGANVLFTYSSSSDLAKEIEKELSSEGVVVRGYKSDASSFEDCQKLVDEITQEFDVIDILINNAGITRDNLLMRMNEDDFDKVIEVNLKSVFNMTKAIQRTMLKQRFGSIINMSSVVGVKGNAGQSNYAASKAGVIGMTKSLASEVASRNITVNCIAPGYIKTAMTESLTEKQTSELLKLVPSGRMGAPEDIAASVLYLSSEEASYLTGQTIHINGGLAMV